MSIIRGIFRYSTVPFLKLRAHTVFIRRQMEPQAETRCSCFEEGHHESIVLHRGFSQATQNTGKKLKQDVLLCKRISKHCSFNFLKYNYFSSELTRFDLC